MTVRSPCSSSPRSGTPAARAVQRHRRHPVPQVHPAADPGAVGGVVLAALRRADPAQLGVDGRAVVALVVVLGEDLPVRGRVVARAGPRSPGVPARTARPARPAWPAPRPASPPGPPEASTNTRPCHSVTGSCGRPHWPKSNPGCRRKPAAPRSSPSSEYVHAWYGQMIDLFLGGFPAWQQLVAPVPAVFANARNAPSSPRTSSTPPCPVASARWSPGSGSWSLRATQIQPPPKKCRCSQLNTAGSTYAARGSIRLSPNGRSVCSSSARSSGAGVYAACRTD